MNIQNYLITILDFLNTKIVPFIVAIALLFFLINILRYFILGGANEESQKKAKLLAGWGLVAFVLLVALWGIVNLFLVMFGIGGSQAQKLDYLNAGGIKSNSATQGGDWYQTDPGDGANQGADWYQTDPGDGANQGADWYQTDTGG